MDLQQILRWLVKVSSDEWKVRMEGDIAQIVALGVT